MCGHLGSLCLWSNPVFFFRWNKSRLRLITSAGAQTAVSRGIISCVTCTFTRCKVADGEKKRMCTQSGSHTMTKLWINKALKGPHCHFYNNKHPFLRIDDYKDATYLTFTGEWLDEPSHSVLLLHRSTSAASQPLWRPTTPPRTPTRGADSTQWSATTAWPSRPPRTPSPPGCLEGWWGSSTTPNPPATRATELAAMTDVVQTHTDKNAEVTTHTQTRAGAHTDAHTRRGNM